MSEKRELSNLFYVLNKMGIGDSQQTMLQFYRKIKRDII